MGHDKIARTRLLRGAGLMLLAGGYVRLARPRMARWGATDGEVGGAMPGDGEVPEPRSAVITAVRTVGGTFGVAVLGSVLNSAYRAHLPLPGAPAAAADVIRSSVMAGVAAAHKLGAPVLLHLARAAFVHGMDTLLWACGGIGLAGLVLALIFLPTRLAAAAKPAAPAPGTATARQIRRRPRPAA